MIDGNIDRVDVMLTRLRLPLGIIGAVWFALICAQYAGFVRLPDFALLHGAPAIVAAVAFNALYWGFVYPRVEQRRKARQEENSGG